MDLRFGPAVHDLHVSQAPRTVINSDFLSYISVFASGLTMDRPNLSIVVLLLFAITGHVSAEVDRWCRNVIDEHVRSKHAEVGYSPTAEADPRSLVRRLSLDLIGLPPTVEEVERFLEDQSGDRYEQLVDRLLASPRFGERMAQFWLDLARYADSDGYHDDTNRSMWPWRDYVIRSFNQNKPFDEFTIEQLAGDLIPNATIEQQVATAFHRNAPTSSEDGANPYEYRARYAVDRVNTTSQVWLGLTVQCAECHDHKYDSITQREYYQLFAFFNQSPEEPLFRGLHAPPSIMVPDEEQSTKLAELESQLKSLRRKQEQLELPDELAADWMKSVGREVAIPRRDVAVELFFADVTKPLANTGSRRRAAMFRSKPSGEMPTIATGLLDRAIRFEHPGDAVDLAQLVEFGPGLPFTFEAWVKSGSRGGPLLDKTDSDEKSRGIEIQLAAGRVTVRLVDAWPERAIEVATSSKQPTDQWTHVSVTWNGLPDANGIFVYVNGESQDLTLNVNGPVQRMRNRAPLLIGGNQVATTSFDGLIDEVRIYQWPPRSLQLEQLPFQRLGSQHSDWLTEYFKDYRYEPGIQLRKASDALESERDRLTQIVPRLRIMRETNQRRPTFVLKRGDFRSPGEQVTPQTPSMLPPLPNRNATPNRLDLARWLVEENAHHTAKVFVNRIWARFFGRGIVSTLDDFGIQGGEATHPELLNSLAERFVESGWDVKRLITQVVTSATYRQSTAATTDSWKRDPENKWLARGPRQRLSAEAIRDNSLRISGLLSDRIGGPSVKPYQPAGLWREMSKGDETTKAYSQDHGESLYRRGVYTFWKRSIHYPTFAVLDAPNREVCTSGRAITNNPTQALALMNDPTFVEAARAFATLILREEKETPERIDFAYRRAMARHATETEQRSLSGLLEDFVKEYTSAPEAAKAILSVGELPLPDGIDQQELAAWTALAQVILTLDETITKE